MANKSFFFADPPFRFLADRFAKDAGFLDDAKTILKIDQDAFLLLAAKLAKAERFLSIADLDSVVSETLGSSEDSDQITLAIGCFASFLHDADMDVMEAMEALGSAIKEGAESLEPQERRALIDRLRKLVAEPIGFAKQFKAQQLVDATGAELDDFQVICDIRPIFDRERGQIDGAIPLAILRLEYSKPDGESAVTEMRVTEKQIAKFGEKFADAQLKLKMIKELLVRQDLSMPKTKSTVTEDDS